jgi:hypothetical protein
MPAGEMADIDDLGRLAGDHRATDRAGVPAENLHVQLFLDDIDDFVDGEPHPAVAVREHQQRLPALGPDVAFVVEAYQRHELAAILHEVSSRGVLDPRAVDFLEPRDE